MIYVFEEGQYPNQKIINECHCLNDEAAIRYAIELRADYVWKYDPDVDRNPNHVWRKPL